MVLKECYILSDFIKRSPSEEVVEPSECIEKYKKLDNKSFSWTGCLDFLDLFKIIAPNSEMTWLFRQLNRQPIYFRE